MYQLSKEYEYQARVDEVQGDVGQFHGRKRCIAESMVKTKTDETEWPVQPGVLAGEGLRHRSGRRFNGRPRQLRHADAAVEQQVGAVVQQEGAVYRWQISQAAIEQNNRQAKYAGQW